MCSTVQDLRSSVNVSSVSSFGFDFSMQNLRFSPRSPIMVGGGVSVVHRLCIFRFCILFGVLVGLTWWRIVGIESVSLFFLFCRKLC